MISKSTVVDAKAANTLRQFQPVAPPPITAERRGQISCISTRLSLREGKIRRGPRTDSRDIAHQIPVAITIALGAFTSCRLLVEWLTAL